MRYGRIQINWLKNIKDESNQSEISLCKPSRSFFHIPKSIKAALFCGTFYLATQFDLFYPLDRKSQFLSYQLSQ
jgi:hypothetical protein